VVTGRLTIPTAVTASKDDAPAAVQAAIVNVGPSEEGQTSCTGMDMSSFWR
jgi:hypothetical protein